MEEQQFQAKNQRKRIKRHTTINKISSSKRGSLQLAQLSINQLFLPTAMKNSPKAHQSNQNLKASNTKTKLMKTMTKNSMFRMNQNNSQIQKTSKQSIEKKSVLFNARTLNIYKRFNNVQKKPDKLYRMKQTSYARVKIRKLQASPQSVKEKNAPSLNKSQIISSVNNSLTNNNIIRRQTRKQTYKQLLTQVLSTNSQCHKFTNFLEEFDANFHQYVEKIQENCDKHYISYHEITQYPKCFLNYYVEAGNNDKLIREALNKRWWWEIKSDIGVSPQMNFLWTQLYDQNIEEFLLKKQKLNMPINSQISETFDNPLTEIQQIIFLNHFKNNKYFSNNIGLAFLMQNKANKAKTYFPSTFYINKYHSQSWFNFTQIYFAKTKLNPVNQQELKLNTKIWMIKSAQGIKKLKICKMMSSYKEIKDFIRSNTKKDQTFIIQECISNQFLMNGQKLDIHTFILVTRINGIMKGYWFKQGFIQIASKFSENSCSETDLFAESAQINHHKAGEIDSKINFTHFQNYCKHLRKDKFSFVEKVIPLMKEVAKNLIQQGHSILAQNTTHPTFEIFELKLTPWLISININHNLSTTSAVLQSIYPPLIDDALKLTIDLYFPPPTVWPNPKKLFISRFSGENNYELIYDQLTNNSLGKSIDEFQYGSRIDEEIKKYEESSFEILNRSCINFDRQPLI